MKKLIVIALISLSMVGCVRIKNDIKAECLNGVLYYTYTQKTVDSEGNDVRIYRKEADVLKYHDNTIVKCK